MLNEPLISRQGPHPPVSSSLLVFLYAGHFLARWGARMWEFSVGLYMISIWPDSLLLAAAYGVVESASTALFGPVVGQWIDKLTYVKVLQIWLLSQNLSFLVAGVSVVALLVYKEMMSENFLTFISLILLTNISGALGVLSTLAGTILVEREWVVVISEGQPPGVLSKMNSIIRRIDLICKLHCKGLPLAVVAIAGLLQKTEKRLDSWKRISKSLSSEIINDPENRCMEILELSYKHLPDHLKACFLYLGVFLEDKDIPVNKLMQFWQAEGFIQKADSKSMEDDAEDCLMDLINRSLVMISKTRSNGKIKACRLHDLLRDLCHSKAKEKNFLQLITRNDEPYASFPDSNYGMEFDNIHLEDPVTFKSYRLSIHLKRNHFIDSRPSSLVTRSLVFFASTDSEPRCPYDISFICHKFKLLRVLDFECINMGVDFPAEIGVLVQLRYLAVSGYVQSIPPSISNLWKLETLVVKGLRSKVILPETIWSMASLRHLHVNNHVAFNLKGHEDVESSLHLDNLISFSTPSLSYGGDTMNIFRRLLNLHTMKCIFLESWDSSRNCNRFPILDFLTHLESIKIIYHGRALNSGEFVLPLNLKKLTLSKFRLPWIHTSMIGRLPNLRVLKLLAGAFEGQRWDMKEEEFKELKFLKLDTLNIAEWNATADHLPSLERLVLRNCKDLEKIPDDFADIATLQTIEVQWCGQSVEESAKEIGDAKGEEIKVLISHS